MRTTDDDGTVVESSKAGTARCASLCESGRNFRCAKSRTAAALSGEMLRDSRSSTPYAKAVPNDAFRVHRAARGSVVALVLVLLATTSQSRS